MIIIGIDPGTQVTGYGLIRIEANCFYAIDYGCIRPPAKDALQDRYRVIYESIEILLERHKPAAMSIESQFVLKNAQSAIKLGMAKGMAMLAAARRDIPVHEYAPKKAKLAVVGHGQASKQQVQRMIQTMLCLPTLPEPEDAADALALAICHAHTMRNPCTNISKELSKKKNRTRRLWKQPESDTGSPFR